MKTDQPRAGTTLAELILTISIMAAVAAFALPQLTGARDEYAVRAARDAAAALVDRTRSLAQLRGSGRVLVDPRASEIRIEAPIGTPVAGSLSPRAEWGAEVLLSGRPVGVLALDFDARGLGRLANRTLRFRRGDREARLSLSTYGRVRRW